MKSIARASRARSLLRNLAIVVAIGLITYGAWGVWNRYQTTHNPTASIPVSTVNYSTVEPDETPLDDECDSYSVAENRPRKLVIDSLSIESCIQPVGVDQHNAIAVPTNIHLTGWFVESALPGTEGVSILDGHAGGRYFDAVFNDLVNILPGADITIEMGDGRIESFEVVDINSYPIAETAEKMFEKIEGVDRQLTLITCDGLYDQSRRTFDERVVVRAKLSRT